MARRPNPEEIADRLHSAAIHVLHRARLQDAVAGISPARLSALSVIVFGGPTSLNNLAQAEQVRPPTMSRIVDALEGAGLARRACNEQDRRAILVEATAKGRHILKQGRRRRVTFLAAHLARMSRAELMQLEKGLRSFQKIFAGAERKRAHRPKRTALTPMRRQSCNQRRPV